jgi:uncharacterized membrane protein YdfJ with MMPL/SSD domain
VEHNIASRAGRWSATHGKTAIWGWLAFVVLALFIGASVGTRTLDNADAGVGESGRAATTIREATAKHADEMVLVQSQSAKATGPSFRSLVADVQRRLEAVRYTRAFESPYAPGNQGQISADRHSTLIRFEILGDDNQVSDRVSSALDAVAAVQAAHPDFTVGEFGDASVSKQLNKSIGDDFKKALVTSLPITLIILLIAFGALVAAGVPLLLALTAVMATIGLIGPISQIGNGVDSSINEVILLIGLAVGVDYSMFYLRREREEREAGRSEDAALAAAAATSGRAVMISGLTVMIAMAGMYLAGAPTFQSFATGTILVVAVAVVGSLTVLPAVLSWLGDRVEKGGVPIIRNQAWNAGESGVWAAVVNRVLRRPTVSLLAAGGLLVFLAIPAFSIHTANQSTDSLPQNLDTIKTYNKIQDVFPGGGIPNTIAVSGRPIDSPPVRRGIAQLISRAEASPLYKQPITTTVLNPTVAQINIPAVGDGSDARSNAALTQLRDSIIPQTIGAVPGVTADVTGYTASSRDFTDVLKSHVPLVFAFVLAAAFLLLLFTFRSIVIPLKAIVLNLLSVGAAYGILVWIFQYGHLEGFLGFHSDGSITSWMPLFLFVVLFGLSMDYHVFILTRIREGYDSGMRTEDAVSHGIKTTAGVVTSAAVVMVAVFAVFATLSLVMFKELGVGLGVAVLIDATLVRAVLLPATMKLLGDWNWYLPSWLEWLPKISRGAEKPPERRPSGGEPEARPTEA